MEHSPARDPVALCADNALFHGLPRASVAALAEQIPLTRFAAGDVIISEGNGAAPIETEIYLLLSGTVSVSRRLRSDEMHAVTQMGAGEFFGEMALIAPGPRSAQIRASEAVLIGRIDRDLFDRIIELDPVTVVKTIARSLARRLREANDTIIATHLRQEKLAAIGSITGQIAHDLRSPLSAVAGVADLMVDQTVEMPRERQAEILRRAVQSISGLVDDILAFASDRVRPPSQRVALTDVLKNVEDFGLAPLERRGRVKVKREIQEVAPIVGDEVALQRMLLNLIKNAAEAMPQGGTLTVGIRQLQNELELVVADTGGGIPDEIRGILFQSFVTAGKRGGTGLGLAMVKRTVDAHGGTIAVDSTPSVGTTFTVRIPIAQP